MTWQTGHAFEAQSYVVTRADLVRYAGASGDFNPIHWSDRVASSVQLPGVIAHGMYTLALASRAVTQWAGHPASVQSFGARFTKPVPVPDDDIGTVIEVAGVVRSADADMATIDVTVTNGGAKVLGMCKAVVRTDRDD
jgi:acyl dehydratase